MGGVYALCSFCRIAITQGDSQDRIGRKKYSPWVSLVLLSVGSSQLLLRNFWWVLIGRVIDGVTGGNMTIAQAILSDISKDEKERAQYFGILGWCLVFRWLSDPFLGGFLVRWGYAVPFWWQVLSVFSMLFLSHSFSPKHINQALSRLLLKRAHFQFWSTYQGHTALYLWTASLVGLELVSSKFYSLYMDRFYHLSISQISYVLMGVGVFMAFVGDFTGEILAQEVFSTPDTDDYPHSFDHSVYDDGRLWPVWRTSYIGLDCLWGNYGIFTIAMWPVLQSEWVSKASADTRGEVSGYFSSVFSLTAIVAPILGGYFINHMISPMWIVGVFSAIAFVVFGSKRGFLGETKICFLIFTVRYRYDTKGTGLTFWRCWFCCFCLSPQKAGVWWVFDLWSIISPMMTRVRRESIWK